MNILWIGGWAIPINAMEIIIPNMFPTHNHHFIHPTKTFESYIDKLKPDVIVGYSLGATLLLNSPPRYSKEYLIAPFLPTKHASYVNETQLKYLLRRLKNNPLDAVNDFYERAQLSLPKLSTLPYTLSDLIWGIETLIKCQDVPISIDRQILIGNQDPLINSAFFLVHAPNLINCLNADHNLQNYLNFLPF